MSKNQLPKKSEHPSDWYTTVIRLADLVDYGPAKTTRILGSPFESKVYFRLWLVGAFCVSLIT